MAGEKKRYAGRSVVLRVIWINACPEYACLRACVWVGWTEGGGAGGAVVREGTEEREGVCAERGGCVGRVRTVVAGEA